LVNIACSSGDSLADKHKTNRPTPLCGQKISIDSNEVDERRRPAAMTSLSTTETKMPCTRGYTIIINQSINFYLLKMSRDTHKKLFKCEQDNKAETSTNRLPVPD